MGREGMCSYCLGTPGSHLIFGSPGWCLVTPAVPWTLESPAPGMLPTQSGGTLPGELDSQEK